MLTEMEKRRYQLRERALRQEDTRTRIVDAAIALHEEIGPAATTISALAERAGVQRLTVYRHFPSDDDILLACSAKWFGLNPPPDMSAHEDGDASARRRAILQALYGYYRDTQKMWASVYRDAGKLEALDEILSQFDAYLAAVEKILLATARPRRSKSLRATVAHAVRFSTWQSLDTQGLGPKAMATLVGKWILAAAD